jgi:hypothetical protein
MDPALISSGAALAGALIGGGASFVVAAYTQRNQERLQRVAHEIAKRETVYAEFMMHASRLLLQAFVQEQDKLSLGEAEQRAIGLINRMRLFAPPDIISEAEAVLKSIIEVSLRPGMTVGQLAREALSHTPEPDPFLRFSRLCRDDLDKVSRTMG